MPRKKLPEFDENKLGVNPLTNGLEIEVTMMHPIDKREFIRSRGIWNRKELMLDKKKAIKLYRDGKWNDALIALTPAALKLQIWIMNHVEKDKDFIQINYEMFMLRAQINSYTTYNTAKKELIREGFIAASCEPGVFFINPRVFFFGDRVKKYKEKTIIKSDLTT